ncbi:MAG TPA: phosphatidylserine decarboxylase family protein [Gemmataceae bacterium]|nr:phosphatidylserine decarboxylase family protein [Gemmataceae bacterium]
MNLELAWGRFRRATLRLLRPGYVRAMASKRQGECPHCPHDIIDPRDLKYWRNVCGFWFRPKDDHFQWRGQIGFARAGLAELLIFTLLLGAIAGSLSAAAALLHWALWIGVAAALLVWLEVVWFFRDPERAIPADTQALVSPADGTVTHVEEVDDADFPGGRALRISIFLSIFNVHVNRLPREGRVTGLRYYPGAFLDARHSDCAQRNEQLWIDLQEPSGRLVRVKQISGAIARRIVCWLKLGEEVKKGERLGMIKFGSRTDVLVAASDRPKVLVKVGDKVRGAATVLLFLNQ